MSIYAFTAGLPRTVYATLAGGTATTMLAAANVYTQECVVLGIVLTNHSGGTLTPTVDVYDGTTAFILADTVTLTDTASVEVSLPGGFYKLIRGNSLRVTAAANLSYHLSYIEPDPNMGAFVHGA